VLAGPFTVVLPGLSGAASAGLAPAAVVPALFMMLAGVVAVCSLLAAPLEGRGIALGVGAAFAGWALLGFVLDWPVWLLAASAAIIVAWLLTESLFRRPHLRRVAAVLSCVFAAALLFALSDAMVAGQMAGDPAVEFGIGLVLTACGIGWGLPWIMRLLRVHRRRAAPLFLGGLLLAALLVGTGETLRAAPIASAASSPSVSPALQGAIDTLVADAKGMPVVAAAPLSRAPVVATETGLPVLLAAPEAETTLRNILRPSFDSVSAGRLRALGEIYGADATRTAAQVKSYAVDYILLGPDERSLYGAQAGAGLRQLVANGTLQQIYARQDVALFRNPDHNDNPPFIAKPANLPIPPLKNGMLDRPLAELPVVGEYAWNGWANTHQLGAVLLWLVLFELLGLLAWPLCARIFPRASDGGWSWSKLVGLLVWGYAIWLPVSLGWWSYRWPAVVIGAAVLGMLSWLAGGRPVRAPRWRSIIRPPTGWKAACRDLLCSEALFLIAFAGWTLLRAANPDLWHPTLGGEKPFEFGMLNAIVRSPVMPPPDPFFSGGDLNYYYYGLFLVSVPIRATGIDPAIAFNLIVPVLFALLVTAAVTVVRDLTGKWRWGLLGAVLVALVGPPASAFAIGESRGVVVVLSALRPGLAGWGARLGDWFWGPSRIIPNTINEFPFFSYLFADLHAHMIALPVTVLAVALAVEFGRTTSQRLSGAALGLAALVLGTLAAANSWDAPTYGLVIGGVLVGRAWRAPLARSRRIRSLALGSGLAVVLLGGGLLLFLPFFTHYQAMVGGIGIVRRPDRLLDFTAIYGVTLYVSLTLLALLGWVVGQQATNPACKVMGRGGAVALPLLTLAVLLVGAAFGRGTAAAQGATGTSPVPVLAFVLMALVGFALLLALVARLPDDEWLILWIITAGLLVALGIQIVFVRDHLAGSDWERMNTVFKFGLQIWTLLALGAAAAFPLVLRLLRRLSDFAMVVWATIFVGLLLAGATYPVAAIPSRVSMRFQDHPGLTLDGLAYMQTARYEHDGKTIDLHWDAEAVAWLKQHMRGLPVVLQSEAEFYRAYGVRIAASTGLPTVLGRLHEDEQRPVDGVLAREADVQTIYNTPDQQTALRLLQQYHVDYVYVGAAERSYYDPVGLPKWDDMVGKTLDIVYKNPGVRIYRVRAVQVPPAAVAPKPASSAEDSALQALEAEHQARPSDGPTAFGLATAYLQAGRPQDAEKVLRDAAPSNPRDVPLHHLLGDVEAQLGHADLAIAAWQAAIAVNPSAGNLTKLGTGLTQLGRFDEAERVLRQAQQRDPKDPLIHYFLADMARKRKGPNDVDLARREYKAYL
ncbi:MAG TPA: DUF2298 domain-containing protein, partial [Herpetosiphonaceae bacterium]|nr:DUF2298 domain-containing protein [Herpetosiphonaceae bacterium]